MSCTLYSTSVFWDNHNSSVNDRKMHLVVLYLCLYNKLYYIKTNSHLGTLSKTKSYLAGGVFQKKQGFPPAPIFMTMNLYEDRIHHPSIHPSSFAYPGSCHGGSLLGSIPFTGHVLQLTLGDPEAFPGKMGYVVPTANSTSRSPPQEGAQKAS